MAFWDAFNAASVAVRLSTFCSSLPQLSQHACHACPGRRARDCCCNSGHLSRIISGHLSRDLERDLRHEELTETSRWLHLYKVYAGALVAGLSAVPLPTLVGIGALNFSDNEKDVDTTVADKKDPEMVKALQTVATYFLSQ